MNSFKKVALLCLLFPLTGCATYFAMWPDDPVKPPKSPPKIILGQTATYWGENSGLDEQVVDVWRKTGLFKEVVMVKEEMPPTQGTFIKMPCQGRIIDQNDGSFIMGVLGMVTLGILPVKLDFHEVTCTTQFYQNGALLTTSYSTHTYKRMWSSWVAWLLYSREKVISEGQMTAAAHIVSKDLVALKKAFP